MACRVFISPAACTSDSTNRFRLQRVFRYSRSAFFSCSLKRVPYSWPHRLFPELSLLQSVRKKRRPVLRNNKTNIVDVVFRANIKLRHALRGRLEQLRQRRHRAVMQIRRCGPNSLQHASLVLALVEGTLKKRPRLDRQAFWLSRGLRAVGRVRRLYRRRWRQRARRGGRRLPAGRQGGIKAVAGTTILSQR